MTEIKDSGEREEFSTGMVRDTQSGKPRFDLMFPLDVPFEAQMLTRVAMHLSKGAQKYAERNWEKGSTQEEVDRALASLSRHFAQYISGETDEDHAAAVIVNVLFAETMKWKRDQKALVTEAWYRVLKDRDGDLWIEVDPDRWRGGSNGNRGCADRTALALERAFGPVTEMAVNLEKYEELAHAVEEEVRKWGEPRYITE